MEDLGTSVEFLFEKLVWMDQLSDVFLVLVRIPRSKYISFII